MNEFQVMHEQYMQTLADLQGRVAQAAVYALQQQKKIDALEKKLRDLDPAKPPG